MARLGVAAFLGSMLAAMRRAVRPSVWYWMGPLIVGLLGYLWPGQNILSSDRPDERLPLCCSARPLPIHYASAGVAPGAMLGYWFGRSWARDRMNEATK